MDRNLLKSWLHISGLALGAFIFVSSELMPIGLLPEISEGLDKSEPITGRLVTSYAWLVAILSLPLTVVTAKMDRRKLLLVLLLIFSAGNIFSGQATSYTAMLISRSAVAAAHAIFWAITPPLAARLAPLGRYTYGLTAISAGCTLAIVMGVPLGTYIGHNLGWRTSFNIVGGTGLLIAILFFFILPALPSISGGNLRSVFSIIRNKSLMAIFFITIFMVTADFTPYTYLVPYLSIVVGLLHNTVVVVLLIIGATGIIGAAIGGKYADKCLRRLLLVTSFAYFGALFGLYFTNSTTIGTVILMIVWSIAVTILGITFQSWILKLIPGAADQAMAIYSGVYNIGIGLGAFMGGLAFDYIGVEYLGFSGAIFLIPAIVLICIFGKEKQA